MLGTRILCLSIRLRRIAGALPLESYTQNYRKHPILMHAKGDYEHTLLNQDIDFHRFECPIFKFNVLPQLGQTMVPISLNMEQ